MVEKNSLIKKIEEIYSEKFLHETCFVTPVEYHGFLCVAICADDNGCYVTMESDSGFDIFDAHYLYPMKRAFVQKVADKFRIDYLEGRGYYLPIESLSELEIKQKLGRFATFMDVCALYKYIGYHAFDREVVVKEFGEDYFDKYFSIDNEEFVDKAVDFAKAKETLLKNDRNGWIDNFVDFQNGFTVETNFYDADNNKITFSVVNKNGKACVQVGLNFDKVKMLEKFEDILISTLYRYDSKEQCACLYLFEDDIDAAICYAMIASNYEFFTYEK